MNSLTFTTLKDTHVHGVADCVAESFAKHEPLGRYLNITKEELLAFAEDISVKAANDGLSVVALDSDQVIGCSLAEDYNDQFVPLRDYGAKLNTIFSLLEELSIPFASQKHSNKIAHAWVTAVDEAYSKKGIAGRVNLELALLLGRKGYYNFYAEFTNDYNLRSIRKLKTTVVNTIPFCSWEMNGKKVFENLSGEAVAVYGEIFPSEV
jgi:predicted GNAT family acetyltransferase